MSACAPWSGATRRRRTTPSRRRRAGLLAETARSRGWALREPRQPESCLRLLGRGGPGVLVLRLGHDLVRELTLLERVSRLRPEAATVVVGDTEDPALAGLAWEL